MATIPELRQQYEDLDRQVLIKGEEAIDTECLPVGGGPVWVNPPISPFLKGGYRGI